MLRIRFGMQIKSLLFVGAVTLLQDRLDSVSESARFDIRKSFSSFEPFSKLTFSHTLQIYLASQAYYSNLRLVL